MLESQQVLPKRLNLRVSLYTLVKVDFLNFPNWRPQSLDSAACGPGLKTAKMYLAKFIWKKTFRWPTLKEKKLGRGPSSQMAKSFTKTIFGYGMQLRQKRGVKISSDQFKIAFAVQWNCYFNYIYNYSYLLSGKSTEVCLGVDCRRVEKLAALRFWRSSRSQFVRVRRQQSHAEVRWLLRR